MNQQTPIYPRNTGHEQAPTSRSELVANSPCVLIPVTADLPYPPVAVEQPNYNYARMLYQPLADASSEMTAVHQYTYQSWIFLHRDRELSQLLGRIASVEMQHLSILGELIVLLGGNPKLRAFRQNGFQFWNAGMLRYQDAIPDILQTNLAGEKNAVATYQTLARLIHDEKVSAVLSRLAMDELLHVQILENKIHSLQAKA